MASVKTLWAKALRRIGLQKLATRQAWAGAQVTRLNDFIFSTIQSANQELRYELTLLRARARELSRNNPNARRFLAMLAQNVVGHKGIRLEVQTTFKTGKNVGQPDEVVNDAIETAWKDWGRPGSCDVTRKLSWVSLQQMVMQTAARDGEALLRIVEGFDNEYGFALQLLDADQLDETYNVPGVNGQPRIDMGVESDQWGAPSKYWLWSPDPSDPSRRKRTPYPARDIIHLFIPRRAGQARGETWFAPVMIPLRMLAGYQEAELIAARTAAAKMGFILQGDDAEGPDPNLPVGVNPTMEANPGSIEKLGKGETFSAWSPEHPSGNYGPFSLNVLRDISAGLNVSYMGLTGDLTSANYSSARVGLLDERDGWRSLQTWLAEHLHDVVYRRWLRFAVLTKLKLPDVELSKYEDVVWRPRGWAWVDPKNDIEAAALAVDRGFESPYAIVAENGDELIDIYEDIGKAKKLAADLDIELSTGVNPRPAADKIAGETPKADPATQQTAKAIMVLAENQGTMMKAIAYLAGRDQPVPVFHNHITSPDITVDARTTVEPAQITVTTPDIRVEPTINVAASEPAHVNVTTPEVRIEPTVVNVAPAEVRIEPTVVNVAPAKVTVQAPKSRRKRATITGQDGKTIRTVDLEDVE